MATQTRTGRGRAATTGRAKTSGGTGRFARGTATPRHRSPAGGLRRRQPEPSGLKKVASAVLPTAAAKKAAPSSKKGKAGGVALAAAAAGMAFKNRDKLTGMLRKQQSGGNGGGQTIDGQPMGAPPSTPTV